MTTQDDTPSDASADEFEQTGASEESEVETGGDEADDDTETETQSDDESDSEGDDEGEGDDGEEDDDDDERPKRRSRSDRYRSTIDTLRRENEQLKSRTAAATVTDADIERHVETIVGAKPKEEDFGGDYLAFERAMTVYELDKRSVTRDVKQRVETHKTEAERINADRAEAHKERVAKFAKSGVAPDFTDAMKRAAAANVKVSPIVEDLILDSEKSGHLAYHLAKNPKLLDRLNAMSERNAARELGRIESGLSLPKKKTATDAPRPVARLKGSSSPSSPERDLDKWLKKTYS